MKYDTINMINQKYLNIFNENNQGWDYGYRRIIGN